MRNGKQCDALITANLSHIVHLPFSPLYTTLVEGSWTKETQRRPYCFVLPGSTAEVAQSVVALRSAGDGAGDWHIAIRSGGHGADHQNSIDEGVIIDLTHLNATTYDASTKVASLGTGPRWGDVYSAMQEHGVGVTGGRQSVVGVGGLTLGGGVGWTTPRTGFACDSVVNYEIVLASGGVVNANASHHSDLWHALKGGSSNFGIVTRFDIDTFPAHNLTLERRTVGPEHSDDFVDAIVDYANLDESTDENAIVSVIGYSPQAGITMTVTEVNTVNDIKTTAFDRFNRIPILSTTGKNSYTLPDAAAIDAPELSKDTIAVNVGAGAITFANDARVVRYCFQQHADLVADLKTTLGAENFTTLMEYQALPTYFADIGVRKGGNMLGLERDPRNKLYFALAATLTTPTSVAQQPLVFQKVAATVRRVDDYASSIGAGEDFVYLPYAKALQDPLGSYGVDNVRFLKEVSSKYDPGRWLQRMVPGGFKIDRVGD